MIEHRRKFIKGVGIFGAMATAIVAGRAAVIDNKPKANPDMVNIIEHQNPATITLTSTYGELQPPPPPPPPSKYVFNGTGVVYGGSGPTWVANPNLGNLTVTMNQGKFIPGTEKEVSLKLVPGPDGKLYLNINGEWKEVLTT